MAERTGASERPRGVGWRLWLRWVLASVVGWGVGGVVLGPVFSVVEPAFGLLVGGAAVGAIGGAALGVLQWLVLRRQLARAGWWIVASTIGWAVGGAAFGLVGGALAGFLQWLSAAATVGASRLVDRDEHGWLGDRTGYRLIRGCHRGAGRGPDRAPSRGALGYRRACGWCDYGGGAGVVVAPAVVRR